MESSVREMLDAIDTFFVTKNEQESEELWDVLTALRGPDSKEDRNLKPSTTVHIRIAAFPKFAAGLSNSHMADFVTTERLHNLDPFSPSHFLQHIHYAIKALGLGYQK